MLATNRDAAAIQQLLDSMRRAWQEKGAALRKTAYVDRMKSVHVLERADAIENRGLIHLARQRELDKDAMNVRRVVETVDEVGQVGRRSIGWQMVQLAQDANPFTVAPFVSDVDFARGILANEDGGKARLDAGGGQKGFYFGLCFVLDFTCDSFAVQDIGHAASVFHDCGKVERLRRFDDHTKSAAGVVGLAFDLKLAVPERLGEKRI